MVNGVSKSRSSKPSPLKSIKRSLPSSALKRRNQGRASPPSQAGPADNVFDAPLEDLGVVPALPHKARRKDGVLGIIQYIRATVFDEFPAERSGMNSTRTAEVLNFRAQMPPLVHAAHVHALMDSPTHVEREIGRLVGEGVLRRVVVRGRGFGTASMSESVVVTKHWVERVREQDFEESLKEKYISVLESTEPITSHTFAAFTEDEISQLMRAGFLVLETSAGAAPPPSSTMLNSGALGSALSLQSLASAAAAASATPRERGSEASTAATAPPSSSPTLQPSLPRTGPFLALLTAARTHFLSLLTKSKRGEAPAYLLRERWDGGIQTKNPYGRSKDPFAVVLPGRTRKWKELYGVGFDWVLAECVGAGLVECFDTGTVGLGVRKV